MKLMIFALALWAPLTTASAFSFPQDSRKPAAPAASTSSHRPLFNFEFVLVREKPRAGDDVAAERGSNGAIQIPSRSDQAGSVVQLDGGLIWQPNVFICNGFRCL